MRPNSLNPLAAVTGSIFCDLALVLGLTTASATAQDLDARVAIDPASATVTYDFRVNGPARGFSVVAVAPKLSPMPRPVPPFGTAWLDPRMTMPLGVFPLDGSGQATGRIRLPAVVIGKLNVCWQGVTATSQLTTPRLTSWSSTSCCRS
jgi:hypothetical protein